MEIRLDHAIVHAKDRRAAAQLLGEILDRPWVAETGIGPFSAVYVSDTLTLDFDEVKKEDAVQLAHYAFRVSDAEFDAILGRLKERGIAYRSMPIGPVDHQINHAFGGRLVYWGEPDGHAWEILTVSYARQTPPPAP